MYIYVGVPLSIYEMLSFFFEKTHVEYFVTLRSIDRSNLMSQICAYMYILHTFLTEYKFHYIPIILYIHMYILQSLFSLK